MIVDNPQGGVKPPFRYHALVLALFLSPATAWSEDYFDPAFLGSGSSTNPVDLSVFSQPGGVAEGTYQVSVFMNQNPVGEATLQFKKNAEDQVVPLLTTEQLLEWGVNVSQIPALSALPITQKLDNLSTYIPNATTRLDLGNLRLNISVPQVAMTPNYSGWADPKLWNDGIPAIIANYNLSAGRSKSTYGGITQRLDNLFVSMFMGANAGAWRLRSTMTHSQSQRRGGGQPKTRTHDTDFSNTTLARDIKSWMSTLTAGETMTGSEVLDGVMFKGVKLTSNEDMLPNQLRGFAPSITGIANSNARVTVRQNGNVVYETYVAPGAFDIRDIQQAGLSGDYDVTITEADGSERKFIVPYSSLPIMLRPGGWKYEVASGRYSGNVTDRARNANFVMATAVYGLPKNITMYAGTLLSQHYHTVSAGLGVSLGDFGALSSDVTHSSSQFASGGTQTGQSYRLRYSKSLLSTGTSIDLTALRYSTEHYYNFNEFNREGYQLTEGTNPWVSQRRRSSFQTQLSQYMGEWGSLNFRMNRDDYWGSDRTLTGLSLGYSNAIKGINYSVYYSIDRVKDSQGNWPDNRQISLNVSVPFSLFGYAKALDSVYATTSITHDNQGRTTNQAGISGSLPGNNVNYNVSQGWGNQGQVSNTNLNVGYQGSKGTVSTGYSYSSNMRSLNVNASGGAVLHSGGLTLSNTLGDSVALISAPEATGVSVLNGNTTTDWQGYAVAPYLTAYSKNSIGLDPSTLPENVELTASNINVYPTRGAVVKAQFGTRVGYQVLMTLDYQSTKIPFGAIAALQDAKDGQDVYGIVGDNGQVYMTGLPETGVLRVKWGNGAAHQCLAKFDLSELTLAPDSMLRQMTLTCEPDAA